VEKKVTGGEGVETGGITPTLTEKGTVRRKSGTEKKKRGADDNTKQKL